MKDYVEHRDGSLYLTHSRVPLAHIVREFQAGEAPEAIRLHYPTLTLEQVYGAIAFYLASLGDVDKDIADRERQEDEYSRMHPNPPEIKARFDRLREQALTRRL